MRSDIVSVNESFEMMFVVKNWYKFEIRVIDVPPVIVTIFFSLNYIKTLESNSTVCIIDHLFSLSVIKFVLLTVIENKEILIRIPTLPISLEVLLINMSLSFLYQTFSILCIYPITPISSVFNYNLVTKLVHTVSLFIF